MAKAVAVRKPLKGKDFLVSSIASDEVCAIGRRRVKKLLENLDPVAMAEELLQMQSASSTRTLTSADVFSSRKKKFMDTILLASANRSRAVEMKMMILRVSVNVEQVMATIKGHIKATFSEEIQAKYRTLQERNHFVDSFLAREKASLVRLQGVSEMADVIIDDLDAAGWTSKRIIDVLALDSSDLKRPSSLPS